MARSKNKSKIKKMRRQHKLMRRVKRRKAAAKKA
jgi:hypothetical protein